MKAEDEKRVERIRAELPLGEEWSNETVRFLLEQLDALKARAELAERERDAFVFFAGEVMTPHNRGSE